MNRSKFFKNYLCIGKVLLVLTSVKVDVTVGHLSSLSYVLVSLVFSHTFLSLCLWFANIFWMFLLVYLCQHFSLGFVHCSSFSVGLYVFLQLQLSLYPLWDPLIILCCFKPIIQTMYTVFLSIIPPDSICIFLDGAPTSMCHFVCPSVHLSCTISQEPYII